TDVADFAPSTVYLEPAVLPFTFEFWDPAPSTPALFTFPAEPADMDRICVKFRVVRGTSVIVLLSTSVPVEDVAAWLIWHKQAMCSLIAPADSFTLICGASETFTTTDFCSAV